MITPWAQEEVATVDLGDERLDERLVTLLSALGDRPNLSIPAACGGRAEMEAAYRFFDNDKVTFDKVLQPHCDQTKKRLRQLSVVLLVQDTTELDLTRPEQQVEGVGTLDGSRRGLLVHVTHAFTTDGTPLGTRAAEILNRPAVSHASAEEKRQQRRSMPLEDKESMRWLTGLRQARAIAQDLPGVSLVCVADSEADIYELFAEPRGDQPVQWLFRACQNRAVTSGNDEVPEAARRIREQVLATPVLYQAELLLRGRRAKTAVEKRPRRQNRKTRKATVAVRAGTVPLRPPPRPDRKLPPVTVNVVLVHESHPPAGAVPVEWILVTTLPIDTPEQVRTVVEYYCVRWQIEIFFRTLKSGCRIEQRRFEHVDRVLSCLSLYLIVAWRTLLVCRLGRNCPDMDCEAVFESSEWKAVWMAVHGKKPPSKPPRLGELVSLIARLGGYLQRKDSVPGVQTLWIGMQRMRDLAWAWDSFGPGAKTRGQ